MAEKQSPAMPKDAVERTLPKAHQSHEGDLGAVMTGQRRGGTSTNGKAKRAPRKNLPAAGRDTFGSRKFTVRDKYFRRLMLEAVNRNTSPSTVLDELLSKLPAHRIQTPKPGEDQAADMD